MTSSLLPSLLVLPALVAAPEGTVSVPVFRDVTARTGIEFVHSCGAIDKDWVLEVNGSGVALFDHDGDGDLDIYFVNGSFLTSAADTGPRNRLYRNDGAWTFTDVTSHAGVGDRGWGCGVAVADIDNDGHLDFYVTNWGPNALYRNRGDGTFEHLATSGAEDPSWGGATSFADFNRDGLVDIYVANYLDFSIRPEKSRESGACQYKGRSVFCGPGGWPPAHDSLLVNRGGGRFEDVSDAWGVRSVSPSYGLGTLVVDVQRDGFPDVLVANDTQANFCFLNEQGARFREAALFLGLAYNDYGVGQAGMGLASGDLRGVRRDDIFVTNFEDDTNTLYLGRPDGLLFTEHTFPSGLGSSSYRRLGWGTFFFDAEGDGDLDVFVANGHVSPQMASVRASGGYGQPNQVFLNDGEGRFTEVSARAGLRAVKSSRGAAYGDLDGDGDPDIVVSNIDDAPTILENRSPLGRWLEVRLRGTVSNAAGVGARVTLLGTPRPQERTIQSGMSYASQCELAARFGVPGGATPQTIRLKWPSGRIEDFAAPGIGERVTRVVLTEGEGEPVSDSD